MQKCGGKREHLGVMWREAGTAKAEREGRAQGTGNTSGSVVRCSASKHGSWVQALSQFQEKKAGLQILRRGAHQGRI